MAKLPTAWSEQDGTTIASNANANVVRVQQDGTIRIEQDLTQRILNPVILTPKAPTVWDNL